jgi:hypothetical protein
MRHEEWLDALNMSLAKDGCVPINFYLGSSKERHVILVGVHQYIFEKSNMFKSFLSLQNLFSANGLVNISASWSSVPTLLMQMYPFCWWSLMKWWRTSMCFVLAYWTRLLVSLIVLSFLYSNGTFLNLIPKSFNVAFIQSIYAQQLPAAIIRLRWLIIQHYFASLMTMNKWSF